MNWSKLVRTLSLFSTRIRNLFQMFSMSVLLLCTRERREEERELVSTGIAAAAILAVKDYMYMYM